MRSYVNFDWGTQPTGFTAEILWDTTQPDGQPCRMLDTEKASKFFGFQANVRLGDGLRQTIDCYNRQTVHLVKG